MKIAIIGAGNVGGTLGRGWAQRGHEIIFGVRDAKDARIKKVLVSTGMNSSATSIAEAAGTADIIVLSVPWPAEGAVKSCGNLTGKILVDCTNPLKPDLTGLALGHNTSAAEQIADLAKGARVVKAFNTTGAGNMANPRFGTQAATMFICGDDESAKATVGKLAEELGFEAVDAGPLMAARYLEPLAMLWIHLALKMGWGTNFAFKILKR